MDNTEKKSLRMDILEPIGGMGILVGLDALYEYVKPIGKTKIRQWFPEMRELNILWYVCVATPHKRKPGRYTSREQIAFWPHRVYEYIQNKVEQQGEFKSRRELKPDSQKAMKRVDTESLLDILGKESGKTRWKYITDGIRERKNSQSQNISQAESPMISDSKCDCATGGIPELVKNTECACSEQSSVDNTTNAL